MDAEMYRAQKREVKSVLYAARDLLAIAARMVHDDDGANEQAEKRICEAVAKIDRATDIVS